ncbi:TerC family protein [uncultured Paracoccus sp.]|uniref:TerC family protein n=1 Tax=uncultured Paracoccus sp. TaxID=189685 RepID=UPI0025CEDDC3|nr:TerC family protein [uncultured Paracoccus sp.]
MDFLFLLFLGKPLWLWLTFLAIVLVLLVLDLGVLNKGDQEIGVAKSLKLSAFYITLGVLFGGFVWWQLGLEAAGLYLTAFVVEKSLAMDNVFVIAMIFGFFAIPRKYQHRALFWGILGVIVLRGLMIGFGAALVNNYHWVLYVFAAFLVFTGAKMLLAKDDEEVDIANNPLLKFLRRRLRVTDDLRGHSFLVREPDPATGKLRLFATPLLLALVMIEIADVIFAVDSVPAVFAITSDPYIVYTSNIFAILGLRALYFALAAIIHRFHYLKYALGVLLIFIGSKVFVADLLGWEKFPASISLGVTFAILSVGVAWSLWKTRGDKAPGRIGG